jgi:dolichyl-phosphate-mannose--protein O-mannosyl transferase
MKQPSRFLPESLNRKPRSLPWLGLGLAAVFLGSIALRFWGLGRFNTLVFDEIYFAKFASNFLKGIPLFEGHPPLSTYILAFGIWIGERLSFGNEAIQNGLSGLQVSPVSYRWLNALTGSLIPIVVAGIAYQLMHRRGYALIAGLFTAVDGLLLVESRYALINVYLLLFGLLGHWFFLIALNQPQQRQAWLWLAGFCLGAAAAIKWNGLGFLLGIYLLWLLAWLIRGASHVKFFATTDSRYSIDRSPLIALTHVNPVHLLVYLAVVPALAYWVSWLPFTQLDSSTSFWQWQAKIIDYHHRVGGMDAHRYCSPWYSWLVMWRPIAYFYQTAHASGEPAPIVGPALQSGAGQIVYDVHAMGNPILWWSASAAMLALLSLLAERLWHWLTVRVPRSSTVESWAALYLVVNWLANWLPWAKVTRCVFLYHYMASLIFSVLGIALLVTNWLSGSDRSRRSTGITLIFAILLAFVFWLPIYLGLPIAPRQLLLRQWFPSWV